MTEDELRKSVVSILRKGSTLNKKSTIIGGIGSVAGGDTSKSDISPLFKSVDAKRQGRNTKNFAAAAASSGAKVSSY